MGIRRVIERIGGLRAALAGHEGLLWWLHSAYALALGVVFMWLGARNFLWLRLAAIHVIVIWSASLLLSNFVDRPDHTSVWWHRLRLVINYVTKNFYQQILFFILPIYAGSATFPSRNIIFVAVLGASAIISTLDIVYDRHLSRRRGLNALFFAFNLFAALAVAMPILWSISNAWALRLASLGATIGYVTIALPPTDLARKRTWKAVAAGGAVLLVLIQFLLPYVPPAPLRLTDTVFGTGFDRRRFEATGQMSDLPPGWTGRLYVVTSLHAPLGLKDAVEIRWIRGQELLWASKSHDFVGGRERGFRLWSSVPISPATQTGTVRLEVVTASGQLIGRVYLPNRDQ